MRIGSTLAAATLAALCAAGSAGAQSAMPMDHSGHMNMSEQAAGNPSTQAFEQVAAQMHENMAIEYTGNTDVDFVRGMIPHHQGAIDMAKVELRYGTDPKIRELAEQVIAAQEGEIALMQAWLKANAD